MSEEDMTTKNINKLFSLVTDVKVSTAKIEEHLRTLNGTVARHQKQLDSRDRFCVTHKDEIIRKRNFRISFAAAIVLAVGFLAIVHFLYKPLDLVWLSMLRKLNLT